MAPGHVGGGSESFDDVEGGLHVGEFLAGRDHIIACGDDRERFVDLLLGSVLQVGAHVGRLHRARATTFIAH